MNEYITRNPEDLGKTVRERRGEMKLTQAEAAALCKVGVRFLSELENGKPTLHLGKVMLVLRAFGLILVLKRRGPSHE